MSIAPRILFRRTLANLMDCTVELTGGVLGSYFGMMLAALLVSAKDGPAEQMQHSMWSGFGFGLVFWTFSLSFINRVLIQGLSRASIGKKFFNLELTTVDQPLTWNTIVGRWVMGFGSFTLFGAGYFSAFFNKEGRTFHDIACFTKVVEVKPGAYGVEQEFAEPLTIRSFVHSVQSKQGLGTVYHLPIVAMHSEHEPSVETLVTPTPAPAGSETSVAEVQTLADVIDFGAERAKKVAAQDDDSDSGSQAA